MIKRIFNGLLRGVWALGCSCAVAFGLLFYLGIVFDTKSPFITRIIFVLFGLYVVILYGIAKGGEEPDGN